MTEQMKEIIENPAVGIPRLVQRLKRRIDSGLTALAPLLMQVHWGRFAIYTALFFGSIIAFPTLPAWPYYVVAIPAALWIRRAW